MWKISSQRSQNLFEPFFSFFLSEHSYILSDMTRSRDVPKRKTQMPRLVISRKPQETLAKCSLSPFLTRTYETSLLCHANTQVQVHAHLKGIRHSRERCSPIHINKHYSVCLKAGSNIHGMKMQSTRVPSIKFPACKTVT